MDTSKEYIKMCEEAKEIQELAPRIATRIHTKNNIFICSELPYTKGGLGGFFYCKDKYYAEDEEGVSILTGTDVIWLPRQDQLQEMIPLKSKFHRIVDKLYDFTDWIELNAIYTSSDCSFEQLWLGFVMKNNYNKHWDWKNNKWTK